MAQSTKQKLQIVCHVGYPEIAEPNEDGKYSVLALVSDSAQIGAVEDLLKAECQLGFQSDEVPAGAFNPIRSAQEKKPDGEFAFKSPFINQKEGAIVLRAKSGFQPKTIFGPNQTPCDAADISGGDECVIEIAGYSYKNQSTGVAFSLNGVWKINAGNGVLERGGSGGAFSGFDASKLKFRGPNLSNDNDAAL
ncbi:DUF2815 family protein [Luminiphilus sp.]|nr:DUF2815 family protein [Luminiphilus sp.]